ncbi:hypothetical protein FA15DRAFT_692221 [Coprinopsis marcescibilis]|uniref:AP-3 complex subunit beta n=1 Tax=Coprinopsis marcescibilis TaxID=230819 RepID=A0A5C3LGV2_COPMA|nr:hypothetical protein FA15DRAFT_692221 [Coprinopsis marcescibilis]
MALSNQYIQTLTTNATRLGTRIQESITEQASQLAAVRGAGASSYLDSVAGPEDRTKVAAGIKKQLESNSEREKLDALKRLVALMSKSHPPSSLTLTFFPSVVKLVASPSIEVRKLVYIYLLHHSPYDPDLALLSINTFQKDLSSDPNPLIRAMALRVLSGMRVPMVGNVVVMGIKKCASDTSPYVRKVAALAIPKCYELDPSHLPSLLPILTQTLLSPSAFSPLCIGATIYAFNVICPGSSITHLSLIHPYFRRLCKVLIDVDEWGQVEMMKLLLRYARVMLPRPTPTQKSEDEDDEVIEDVELDKDLKLLLDSAELTFQSRNPAVILAATRVFYYLAPSSYFGKFVNPLLRLADSSSPGVERVVYRYLVLLSRNKPDSIAHLLAPHYSRFFVRLSTDSLAVKKDKIRLLINLITPSSSSASDYVHDLWPAILREFVDYADDTDDAVVRESIQAIGVLAKRIRTTEAIKSCLSALMNMIKSPYDIVVSSAVQVLKDLVYVQLQQTASYSALTNLKDPASSPLSIVAHLAKKFDDIKHAEARACVIWLVGQYAGNEGGNSGAGVDGIADWAPDVLRKGAKTFASEEPLVKLQLLTLAAKLVVLVRPQAGPIPPEEPGTETTHSLSDQAQKQRKLALLAQYVVSGLARYDTNNDVRDRARMVWGLIRGIVEQSLIEEDKEDPSLHSGSQVEGVVLRREQVKVVLFEGKAVGTGDDETLGLPNLGNHRTIGSLDLFTTGPVLTSSHTVYTTVGEGDEEMVVNEDVPEWMEKGVESKLRESEDDQKGPHKAPLTAIGSSSFSSGGAGPTGFGNKRNQGGASSKVVLVPTNFSGTNPGSVPSTPGRVDTEEGKKKWKDLDAFYAEEEEEEESEESEDDEDEEAKAEGSGGEEGEEEEEESEEEEEESGEEEEESEEVSLATQAQRERTGLLSSNT